MEAECVCVYASSNAKADSLSCPIVESRYVFTRFKKAERPFDCCWWRVALQVKISIGIRMQVFVYKFQCLTQIAWVYRSGLWGIILNLRSIFLLQG
jgi:hypothetical protein